MAKASKIISCAKEQIGYEEPNHDNGTKYGAEMDTIYKGFFNGNKNFHDWCCTFVCWLFCHCFGKAVALQLLNMPGGNLGAVVKYFYNYMKSGGMTGDAPKKGAVIFFQNSRGLSHVGVVVDYTATTVTTVEGNSGVGNWFVTEHTYNRKDTYIYGYGYPKYEAEPEPKPEPKYKRDGVYTVTCRGELNLRTGAGTENPVLMKLHKGDKVHCLKVVSQDGKTWLRVDGYCCAVEDGDIYIE